MDAITSVESDLAILYDWFCANKLSLTVTKTNFMILFPKDENQQLKPETITLGNQNIHRVNCAKFLGIYIDDELQWDQHIQHVSSKLNNGSYAINSVKKTLSTHNLNNSITVSSILI